LRTHRKIEPGHEEHEDKLNHEGHTELNERTHLTGQAEKN